jgi:hypothetical protein
VTTEGLLQVGKPIVTFSPSLKMPPRKLGSLFRTPRKV